MNLNQLLYFYHVAKTGSYSRAAEELDISEPAIHRAVTTLQKKYGIRLLRRTGKRIRVTQEAEAVFEYASRIASLSNMTEQAIAEQKTHFSGRLSLGVGVSVVLSLLPAILPRWASEHPLVDLSISQGMGHELQEELLAGRLDLAISAGTKWAPPLRRELVFSDNLVVVAPAGHPLSQRDFVPVAELSKERMILTRKGTVIRDEVEEVERQYGVQFKLAAEVNRAELAKLLCRAGMGIGVLMTSAVAEDLANKSLSLLNIEAFPRSCPYFLIYRSDEPLTPEMKSLFYAIRLWIEQRERNSHSSLAALEPARPSGASMLGDPSGR